MSVYAISDLHLSLSDAVDKPMDGFGPEWKDHPQKLRDHWMDTVKASDTIIIPGDISWALDLEDAKADLSFIDSLPGQKILLRGNHDFWWSSMKKMRPLFPSICFIQNDAVECGNFVVCGSRLWSFPWMSHGDYSASESEVIFKRELLRIEMSLQAAAALRDGKKLIAATHFPPLDKGHKGTAVTELYQKYGVDIAIYGHLHGSHWDDAAEGKIGGIEYHLVSLDRLDSMPLRLL